MSPEARSAVAARECFVDILLLVGQTTPDMLRREEFLTEFLALVGGIRRRLAAKEGELRRHSEWSGLTSALDVGELHAHRPDCRYVVISGYVGGQLEGVGRVAWHLDASRRGAGWELERAVALNEGDAGPGVELPVEVFRDSGALIEAIPDLTDELLQLPAPQQT